MKIDIFICTFGLVSDGSRDLKRCVYQIKNSDIPIRKITILARDISKELKTFCKKNKINLRKQKENKKLGFHRSECINLSKTEWCLFVDDDVYIPKKWFKYVVNTLDNPKIFAVQGCKLYEQRRFPDYNKAQNIILRVKYKRNLREHGIAWCSFENTLINVKNVKRFRGDKHIQSYNSAEDWALKEYMEKQGSKWISIDNLFVNHNSMNKSSRKKKINWYADSNTKKFGLKKIVERGFVTLQDLFNIFKICLFSDLSLLYNTITIYLNDRFFLLRRLK